MSLFFGDILRAARLGYHWSEHWQCFIRVSQIDDERLCVEAAPPRGLPSHKTPCAPGFFVWWERPECVAVLAQMQTTSLRRAPQSFVRFAVNNDGCEVPWTRWSRRGTPPALPSPHEPASGGGAAGEG